MAKTKKYADSEVKTMTLPRIVIQAKENSGLSWGDYMLALMEQHANTATNPDAMRLSDLRRQLHSKEQHCKDEIEDLKTRVHNLEAREHHRIASEKSEVDSILARAKAKDPSSTSTDTSDEQET